VANAESTAVTGFTTAAESVTTVVSTTNEASSTVVAVLVHFQARRIKTTLVIAFQRA